MTIKTEAYSTSGRRWVMAARITEENVEEIREAVGGVLPSEIENLPEKTTDHETVAFAVINTQGQPDDEEPMGVIPARVGDWMTQDQMGEFRIFNDTFFGMAYKRDSRYDDALPTIMPIV